MARYGRLDLLCLDELRYLHLDRRGAELHERFNRTLFDEWAYARMYPTNEERLLALGPWLEEYNHR